MVDTIKCFEISRHMETKMFLLFISDRVALGTYTKCLHWSHSSCRIFSTGSVMISGSSLSTTGFCGSSSASGGSGSPFPHVPPRRGPPPPRHTQSTHRPNPAAGQRWRVLSNWPFRAFRASARASGAPFMTFRAFVRASGASTAIPD